MMTELSVCFAGGTAIPPHPCIRAYTHTYIHTCIAIYPALCGSLSHITRACSAPCRSRSRWDIVSDPSLSTSAQPCLEGRVVRLYTRSLS
eukprot:COSAG01_NODE_13248_length_1612_cov_15.112360_1_plen_90_part_00